jgi:hypothetical protein
MLQLSAFQPGRLHQVVRRRGLLKADGSFLLLGLVIGRAFLTPLLLDLLIGLRS